jgi:hypothetical protein
VVAVTSEVLTPAHSLSARSVPTAGACIMTRAAVLLDPEPADVREREAQRQQEQEGAATSTRVGVYVAAGSADPMSGWNTSSAAPMPSWGWTTADLKRLVG